MAPSSVSQGLLTLLQAAPHQLPGPWLLAWVLPGIPGFGSQALLLEFSLQKQLQGLRAVSTGPGGHFPLCSGQWLPRSPPGGKRRGAAFLLAVASGNTFPMAQTGPLWYWQSSDTSL